MKFIIIALLVSFTANARQYMQCAPHMSNSTDRMVINLDGDKSTLFMTTGLMTDWDIDPEIRVLKDLFFESADSDFHTYVTEGDVVETVKIPTEVIGQFSNYVIVEVTHTSSSYSRTKKMSCFSAIYEQ